MRLPDFATTTQFRVGFVSGLLLFVAANFYSYLRMDCTMADGYCGSGFPFESYETGGFITVTRVIWSGPVANTCIAVTTSILCGMLCHRLFKPRRLFS